MQEHAATIALWHAYIKLRSSKFCIGQRDKFKGDQRRNYRRDLKKIPLQDAEVTLKSKALLLAIKTAKSTDT